MLAKEYFNGVLLAISDLKRTRERLQVARENMDGLGHSSASIGAISRGGCAGDASNSFLSRINSKDEAIKKHEEAIEKLNARIDEARRVIDNTGDPTKRATGKWRACLEYRYLYDMSIREIATELDMSPSSVHNQLRSACEWLDESGVLADF